MALVLTKEELRARVTAIKALWALINHLPEGHALRDQLVAMIEALVSECEQLIVMLGDEGVRTADCRRAPDRLRRMAERQGLELRKSRRRDPRALDFGRWEIVDARRGSIVAECEDVDQVEAFLTGERG